MYNFYSIEYWNQNCKNVVWTFTRCFEKYSKSI